MYEVLLYSFLVVALAIGWWLGRRSAQRPSCSPARPSELSRDYVAGLHFLLADQPDHDVEALSTTLEVTSATIDTHIMLGRLFRSRGEADRAVKIHQNLLGRPALTKSQNQQVVLELAQDFQRLGLLDRAEHLLKSLINDRPSQELDYAAKRLLIVLFEQEREWQQALDISNRKLLADPLLKRAAANWHCELIEELRGRGNQVQKAHHLKRARAICPDSIRVNWLAAQHANEQGRYRDELKILARIAELDREFIPLILDNLSAAYEHLRDRDGLIEQLDELLEQHPSSTLILLRAEKMLPEYGVRSTARWLNAQMDVFPTARGISKLTELCCQLSEKDGGRPYLSGLRHHLDALTRHEPRYLCRHCGFSAQVSYWHCPQCHQWETVKPTNESALPKLPSRP
ncbi:tetratricopeptide repeat protein [Carnimonas bestiolae]|uniref:tetratricopeptide repeat protein n=1 Tax=Carnimonas bestiolae TaxID=3402172 RepID=UPI003EDBF6E9